MVEKPTADLADPATDEPAARGEHTQRFRYTLPGAWIALVFVCLSFTPSLLPRSGIIQGAICGVTGAIGYGLGVVAAAVWRAFADRDARPAGPGSWRAFFIVAAVAVLVSYALGRRWQSQIRELMGVEPDSLIAQVLLPVIAALVFVGLVAVGRALHRLYRSLAALLRRWIGPRAATAVGWTVVVGGTYLVVSGLVFDTLANLANESFSVANGATQEGAVQPTTTLRSGGPESLISWESLGREGRTFVGRTPSQADLVAFAGPTALEPIRAFAGLESAGSTEDRAALAVDDLERAGGFDRAYLVVATSTGSGWISPGAANSFEFMTGGDSAIVSIQYSYLPSWISYLVDQKEAREAGRALFDAVYDRWSQLSIDDRPKLIIFGESLGTFGGEAAFSGEYDLANRTDGALLVGPPNFNTLYREFSDGREPGSLQVEPIFRNGRIVRFDATPDGVVQPATAPWARTRVLYVQHPSDPIVWWSPNLIFNKPDWLAEPRGRDVLEESRWFPFVTFWQVTADLPLAAAVPPGHGHLYLTEYVDAWAQVLQPEGWTVEKRNELQAIIAPESGS